MPALCCPRAGWWGVELEREFVRLHGACKQHLLVGRERRCWQQDVHGRGDADDLPDRQRVVLGHCHALQEPHAERDDQRVSFSHPARLVYSLRNSQRELLVQLCARLWQCTDPDDHHVMCFLRRDRASGWGVERKRVGLRLCAAQWTNLHDGERKRRLHACAYSVGDVQQVSLVDRDVKLDRVGLAVAVD